MSDIRGAFQNPVSPQQYIQNVLATIRGERAVPIPYSQGGILPVAQPVTIIQGVALGPTGKTTQLPAPFRQTGGPIGMGQTGMNGPPMNTPQVQGPFPWPAVRHDARAPAGGPMAGVQGSVTSSDEARFGNIIGDAERERKRIAAERRIYFAAARGGPLAGIIIAYYGIKANEEIKRNSGPQREILDIIAKYHSGFRYDLPRPTLTEAPPQVLSMALLRLTTLPPTGGNTMSLPQLRSPFVPNMQVGGVGIGLRPTAMGDIRDPGKGISKVLMDKIGGTVNRMIGILEWKDP